MATIIKILLTGALCLHLFSSFHASGSEPPEDKAQKALNALYHFRFYDADSIIGQLEENHPSHYLSSIARAQYYWWKIISQPVNDQLKEKYLQNLLRAEDILTGNFPKNEPCFHDLFHLINVYASRARLDLMNQDYLRAIRHLSRSAGYIRLSLKKEDDFSSFLLTSGLYNYMAGHGEEAYPFFRIYTLRYPRGNKDKGIKQLEKAASGDNPLIRTEASYFLMKIYMEIEENYSKALPYARWLAETYPDNLIYLHHYYELLNQLFSSAIAGQVKSSFFQSLEENRQLNGRQVMHLRNLF